MRVGVEQPPHRGLQPPRVAMLSKGAPRIRLDETLYVDVCAATAPRKEPRIVASVLQSRPKPAAVGPAVERGAQQRKPGRDLGSGQGLGSGLGARVN